MTSRVTRHDAAGRAYLDLRKLARSDGRATDEYLRLYALERFLARLAGSSFRETLVVKGGALLAAFGARRPTADVDLAAIATSNDVAAVQSIVVGIAALPLDDGLLFDTSASAATSIRDDDEYAGVRVGLTAQLATARLSVHVDVNVGDPIWPRPEVVALPQLLGGAIHLLGYPIPMVLAEKLVTAGERGAANTRWRDFADVYSLIGSQELDARDVHSAIRAVAEHRGVELLPLRPQLDGYAEAGQARWLAWRSRQHLDDRFPAQFADVLDHVLTFADGCYDRAGDGTWSPTSRAWT